MKKIDVIPTAEAIEAAAVDLRKTADSLERIAQKMRDTGDISYAGEATSILAAVPIQCRIDLFVTRPLRALML